MQTSQFIKGGLLAVVLSVIAAMAWEIHLRHIGVDRSYDDNKALWAFARGQVYEPKDRTTVFIGSSRIKFDLDIPVWQEITGNHAVQLACVGSSPAEQAVVFTKNLIRILKKKKAGHLKIRRINENVL
jgi:hypothetical protein